MRVVLDTNIIVSATLVQGGNEDRILRAWRERAFDLVLSPQTLEELARAVFYEKLRKFRWMTEGEVASLLQEIAQASQFIPGQIAVTACRDPDDDKFLAAAIEGRARFVVSGDKDLLVMRIYRGIEIVAPAAFLKALKEVSRG